MNRRELENGTEENREVTELLAALPRVEAPGNFDFGVNARIAAGGPKRRSSIFPFLKVAVPLSLVLLIGAFVVYYGTMPGDNSTIADKAVQPTSFTEPAPVATVPGPVEQKETAAASEPPVPQSVEDKDITASTRSPKTRRARRSTNSASSDIRDFEQSITPANVICPPGIDCAGGANARPNPNPNKNPDSGVAVRDLLEMLGMKVDVVGGKWTVISTSANSLAERSGVLANDVVESINDQAISGAAKIKGAVTKTITVGRGGKSIKLGLKH